MELNSLLHYVYVSFIMMAIFVMVAGFCDTCYKIIFKRDEMRISEAIRNGFDKSVLFGLQILIVADIVETIIAPDIQSILRVFAVVVIRTIMSFSLQWEIKSHM
ncbi:MAG: DUF1622 domain-containing protein [Fusobacteriaceae bacterium]